MKRSLIISLVVVALFATLGACKKSDKPLVTPATPSAQASPHTGIAAPSIGGEGAQANPHEGVTAKDVPAGVGHKGRVLESIDAESYRYIQIEENGKKLWVAVVADESTKVKKGDVIEFADTPAFPNFQSKVLNRTFDSVIFASGIRNNGKK